MISNFQYYINKLNEGLISTYPISIFYSNLYDYLKLINVNFHLIPKFENETFKIDTIQSIIFEDIEKINVLCNNLGYYISKFTIFINDKTNTLKYDNETFKGNIKNNTRLILFYESKFDVEILPLQKIYHTTNIAHLRKITKLGLLPRSTSKLQYHLDRIYFSQTLNDCENIINKLRLFDNTKTDIKDYIILEIDTSNFYEEHFDKSTSLVKFRKDPQSNGIYTFNNIPKDRIEIIKTLYQKDDIINFDDIEINKNNILIYKNKDLIIKYKI
ncbi:hypothetical protein M0Q97_06125 [Candidatus Dojkabacteria bacterium]|jgi:hypothetical protein|nr:hypothetical protein [Candidatus Dojkabacteria bacterium]